jgi:hypothetical protein
LRDSSWSAWVLLAPFSHPRGRVQLHEQGTRDEAKHELGEEELDQLKGEALPERAAMSTIQWDLTVPPIVPAGDELDVET